MEIYGRVRNTLDSIYRGNKVFKSNVDVEIDSSGVDYLQPKDACTKIIIWFFQ